jgi:hypothetical protein
MARDDRLTGTDLHDKRVFVARPGDHSDCTRRSRPDIASSVLFHHGYDDAVRHCSVCRAPNPEAHSADVSPGGARSSGAD